MDGRAILGRSRRERPDREPRRPAQAHGRADRDHRGPKPRVAGLQYDRRRQRAAPARSPAVAGRGGRVSAGIARSADTAAQKGRLNPKPLRTHAGRKTERSLTVLRPRNLAGLGGSAGFWPEPPDSR